MAGGALRSGRVCVPGPAGGGDHAADAGYLQAQPGRQIPVVRVCRHRPDLVLGLRRHPESGAGRVFWLGRVLHGDVSEAGSVRPDQHQNPVDARHSRFHGLESDHSSAAVMGAVSPLRFCHCRGVDLAHLAGFCDRHGHVQAAGRRCVFCHRDPGHRGDSLGADYRPARLDRRGERHHRFAHPARLGYPHRLGALHPVFHQRRLVIYLHRLRHLPLVDQAGEIAGSDARQGRARALLRL